MAKINRRQFIALGAAGVATALVGHWLRQDIFSQPLASLSANVFGVYQSGDRLLELDIIAKENPINLAGRQAYLLTYNGQVPAPRLEANPGDRVKIHFTNNLSQPTNIHYHGLHIPITGNADNVFLQILGQYRLLNLPYDRGGMGMMGCGMMNGRGIMGGGMMGRNNRDEPTVIATINYEDQGQSFSIPTKLASISALPKPQTVRRFELNHGMNPSVGMAFLINGQAYNHDRLDTQVQLDTVEDWEITNTGMMDHPFHVHNNAFQVISLNSQTESLLAWRDTVLVPRGETVRIRIPFRDFAGKTVYHCHVLDHEDLGMMGNLMINA